MSGWRQLEPCGVCLEGLEWEMPSAAGLERLDAILDFRMPAMAGLDRNNARAELVGDKALEAMPVEVGDGELRPGMWALAGGMHHVIPLLAGTDEPSEG